MLENILANKESSKTTVSKVVVTAQDKSAKKAKELSTEITKQLNEGKDISNISADEFTTLPPNFELSGTPVTGTEEPPVLSADFQPPNPLNDFAEQGKLGFGRVPHTADDGKFKPYGNYGLLARNDNKGSELTDKANEFACKLWKDAGSYQNVRALMSDYGFPVLNQEINQNNFTYFNSHYIQSNLYGMFSVSHILSSHPLMGLDGMTNLISKLKRLERKHSSEELIDDISREKIIDTILMPTNLYGVTDKYHGYDFIDMRYPRQKSVVNELITGEEMEVITSVLNYIPRLRVLLSNYDRHIGKMTKDGLLEKLSWNSATYQPTPFSRQANPYGNPQGRDLNLQEDKKILNTLRKMYDFLVQVIPFEMQRDLIPSFSSTRASDVRWKAMQKASRNLREAATAYIQEERTLSSLLSAILELSEAVLDYFNTLVDEVKDMFTFLNRIGASYEKIVEESEMLFQNSEVPW